MPSIDYLRELSLLKKGYTPTQAKRIVNDEVIKRFESQSTEAQDSYRKYYSSVFSNAGTNVSSTPSVASTKGLINSQSQTGGSANSITQSLIEPAARPIPNVSYEATAQDFIPPSTKSPFAAKYDPAELIKPEKVVVNIPQDALKAFYDTNRTKPVVLPGGTIPPKTNKTVSSDSPFFIPSTRGNYLREMEAPLPDPITDWVNPNSRQLNYQKSLFEERIQTDRTSSEDFSSLFDPQIPQSEKINKAFALKYKLENELKGIVTEPEVVTGRYKVALQKEEGQKNKNKEKYQLALQQIDQIIEGQNLQLVAQDVLNNPKAKELIQPILSGQPVPADVQKNILGRISSVLGQSENDILSSLTYLSNHRLDDPNKPPTRTDYGQAFQTYLNSKDESESAINGVAVQQQRAISEDLVSINAKLMNAIGNEIVNQQIKGVKKVEELLQEVENFPDFENLTSPEKQKIVDGYNTQINAITAKLKENSEVGKALIETDLQIDNKTDWRLNNAKEGIAAQAKQQAAADLNAGLERTPLDPRNITFLNDLVSGIVETIPRGIRNWQVSSAYDMAIKRAKLTAGGVELPAEGGKTVQDYQNEIKSSLKEYIQSDDYPVIDKIASAQVGRIISADQFFYFDDNAFLGFKMGRGIGRNMGPVLAQQLPSMLLSGGLMSIGGLTVKGILAARAAKTANSVLKTARLAKYAELTAGKTAQQIWRNTIRATASNNTGLAKFGIGLLESRVPTFLAVTASTYPSIYRQTLKELYANKVDDVEKKAKVLAWWSSAIEGLTEGFFPDIDIISAQRYLPEESAFLRFAGKPFKNLQDYMDLVSVIPDLSPASKKLLAKTAYQVKKGLIVSGKVAKTGYKIGFNPGEGFEEVVAELGNHFLNSVYATERGADAEELSPESLINAFAGGAFMTAPMGAVRAGSFYKENDIQSAYRMANSPEFYKDKINKSLQKGKISQEQAIKALAQIDNYTKIVKSKPFRNLVDESTFMEDEEAQYDYFRAVLNKVGNDAFTLGSKDFAKLSDEDKEAYIKNAEEISKDIEKYERRGSAFEKLTEQEKKTRLLDIAKKNVTAYFPVTSLRELEKKKEEHERERAVAQINYKESFNKVKEPLDFVISEVDRVYQERVQAIQEAKDNGTLNPLLEDAYAEEGQEKQAGIDAMDLNEVEKLLIQASLNPDTEGILDETFQILGMYQEAEETKNEVEKQVLKEIAERRGTPTAQLTETDLTPEEIEYLIEQKQEAEDIFDRIVQKGDSFIEALLKKFEPMIRANKITGEEIFNRLLSPEMYYSLLFLKNTEISQKEFVDFESFNELWNRISDFREGFIEDQKKQQEEAREAQRKEEAKKAQDALEAKEREEEKTPEELEDDSTPPQKTELKVDRVAAITDVNQNLKTQADYYTDPNSTPDRKKRSKEKLRDYILRAPNKEQAIARAMFVASLKNEDTPELEALLNTLFSAPAEFFAEEPNNDLLNNFEVGKLLSTRKNKIPAFTNSVIVEEVVEPKEEQVEEEKVEEKEKVEETPEEPTEEATESEDTSKFEDSENYKSSYFVSYSNRDRQDPKSKNHTFANAAQKVTIQIRNNRPLYKIQVTDLFSFLKNNGKAQAVTQLEKYYNEYLSLKQEGELFKLKDFRQEVTNFFETTFSGILPPKELDYHLNEIFFGNYNGIGEKTTSEKQGFKDLNVILGYVTKEGNIVRFDDDGNVNDSGPNLYTLTISRDEKYKSARLGNAIRKHVRDRGQVSISDLSIDFGYNYTTNEQSVGFTASIPDVDTALQALEETNTLPIVEVKPAVVPVVETPVEKPDSEEKAVSTLVKPEDIVIRRPFTEGQKGYVNSYPKQEWAFSDQNISPTKTQGSSIFIITKTSPTTAVFRFEPSAQPLLDRNIHEIRHILEDIENPKQTGGSSGGLVSDDAVGVVMLQEGELILQDGKWVVTKKAKVFYTDRGRPFNENELRVRLAEKANKELAPKEEEQKPPAPTDAKAGIERRRQEALKNIKPTDKSNEVSNFPLLKGTDVVRYIPESVAQKAWEVWDKEYQTGQSLQRAKERGGFGINEMDMFYPEWKTEIPEAVKINAKYDAELARELYKEIKAGKLVTDMTVAEQAVANKYITEELRKSVDAELAALESSAPQIEENITSQEEVDSNVSPLEIMSGAASVQEEAPVAGAKKFTPTAEQQAVIDAAKKGGNVVVRALAGTGKTTTLIETARVLIPNLPEGKKILYVVFNKSAQKEAEAKMKILGNKVEVRTRDSLARQALLNDSRTSHLPEKAERQLKAETKVHFNDELEILNLKGKKIGTRFKPNYSILKLIKQIVNEYAIGSDKSIGIELVEKVMLQNKTFSDEVKNNRISADEYTYILELAQKYWQLSLSQRSEIPFRISHYMKVWSRLSPDLSSEYSVIMMDEAQDINPVAGEIFNNQPTQLIYVGDENQAIYEFIGATNQLENVVAENDLPLSTSWRFGPEIAELGNIILNYLGSNLRLKGKGKESKISQDKISDPNVIISRTNSGAIDFISAYVEQGKRVGIYSKQREQLFNLIAEIKWLKDKKGKNRPPVEDSPFDIYNTWDEVLESKENDPTLTKILKLTNNGQTEELEELLKKTINIPEENPYSAEPYDILVTTAHKSKGGEWDNVQIADDFKPLSKTKWPGIQEFNLAYVAITRAKKNIGLGSLNQWIKTLESLEKESKEKPKGDSAPQQKSQPSAKTPTAPTAPTSPTPQPSPQPPVRREGPMPDKAQGNSAFEFAISSVENLIKFSEKIGEPETTKAGNRVYNIAGKNYISQSAYNKKGDIEKTALLEDAVVMGDINDIIGRDVLAGLSLGDIETYIPSVLEQVKAKQNLPELPKVDNEQIIKYIQELTALRDEWKLNGYTIFTDKVVLYADLQEPSESKGETFEGVAGVPDIILVHESGSVHIVDMKNIKFGSAREDMQEKFNQKKPGWQTQQTSYRHLAQGILPTISSTGILGARTSYEGKTLKDIGLLDLQPYGVKAQDTSISNVGRLGTNLSASPFVSRPNVIFVENNSNPTNNSNNC
jgi:hypothetical protein